MQDEGYLWSVLARGNEKVRDEASDVLREMKAAMGMNYGV